MRPASAMVPITPCLVLVRQCVKQRSVVISYPLRSYFLLCAAPQLGWMQHLADLPLTLEQRNSACVAMCQRMEGCWAGSNNQL